MTEEKADEACEGGEDAITCAVDSFIFERNVAFLIDLKASIVE